MPDEMVVGIASQMPDVCLIASNQIINGNNAVTVAVGVRVISKRTSKLIYDETNLTNAQPFYALNRTTAGPNWTCS